MDESTLKARCVMKELLSERISINGKCYELRSLIEEKDKVEVVSEPDVSEEMGLWDVLRAYVECNSEIGRSGRREPSMELKALVLNLGRKAAQRKAQRRHARSSHSPGMEMGGFDSIKSVVSFFATALQVNVNYGTVYYWVRTAGTVERKRKPWSDQAAEVTCSAALELDRRGFVMDESEFLKLAGKVQNRSQAFSHDCLVAMKQFIAVHEPRLQAIFSRNRSLGSMDWFVPSNVEWWCDTVSSFAVERGHAKLTLGLGLEDNLEFIDPSRVVLMEDLALREGKNSSSNRQRTSSCILSVLVGHNLAFTSTAPVWLCSSDASAQDLQELSARQDQPSPPAFFVSETLFPSQLSRALITLRHMFPDLADAPGKRVLWITNWCSGQVRPGTLQELQAAGVDVVGSLPFSVFQRQCGLSAFGHLHRLYLPEMLCDKRVQQTFLTAQSVLTKALTPGKLEIACHESGIAPFSPKTMLAHPIVRDIQVRGDDDDDDDASVASTARAWSDVPSSSFSDTSTLPPGPTWEDQLSLPCTPSKQLVLL